MVAVVTFENRSAYINELNEMHRHRKQIFVDFLKWDVPVVDGQYEIDQFDTEDAVYLLVLDPDTNAHLGSVRLLPSERPHLLGEVFPFLCEEGVPTGDDIWEITRLCTAPGAPLPKVILGQIAAALMEFGLRFGVCQYTCVAHLTWLNQMLAVGWTCEPLGLPKMYNDEQIGAMIIHANVEGLELFRERLGVYAQPLELSPLRRAA